MEKILNISYNHYAQLGDMPSCDQALVEEARAAAQSSFSPYSKFAVGAAARLASGAILRGTNIESEVYPSGLCAERTLLFHAAAIHPNDPIESLAIVSTSTDNECYPCGACRQSLVDAESRQNSQIKIIMAGADSATVVDSATSLLPFTFYL